MRATEGGVRVRRAEFGRILQAVRDSGVHLEVEALLRPRGTNGRPRQLAADVFLAACIATAMYSHGLVLKNVHYLLTEGIPRSQGIALDVNRLGRKLTVRQVRYLLEAIEKRLAHTQGRAPDLDDLDRATRAAALEHIMDLLIKGTLPRHIKAPISMALDASAMDSWGHGRGKVRKKVDAASDHAGDEDPQAKNAGDAAGGDRVWPDADAEWGYRTRTATNQTKWVHGYHMLAMVGVGEVGEHADFRPKLTYSLTLIPANANAVTAALGMVDRYLATGAKITAILNDREFSYKVPLTWATPLRARGITQVIDVHDKDRGSRDHNGILMLDGWPHCPGTPPHLHKIARPANLSAGKLKTNASAAEIRDHAARVEAIETFRAQIAERWRYAFPRNGRPDATGKAQYMCPGQAGKVLCENCPLSRDMPSDLPVVVNPPVLLDPPERPTALPTTGTTKSSRAAYAKAREAWKHQAAQLLCCRQPTIVIPGDANDKNRQDLYWGSDEWMASYNRRTHVEGAFGQMVGPSGTGMRRGWTRVMGLVKTALMMACGVVATNINALRAWADRTGDYTHPLTQPLPESPGWEELDVVSEPGSPHAPPMAA